MGKTEFGEQQIRDLVNPSLVLYARQKYNSMIVPISPTPHLEHELGWDTGFCVPGLRAMQDDTYGCNLFIQYKVSSHHESKHCAYHKLWSSRDYYLFRLYYTVHGTKDYHQLDNLIDLSNKGFMTVYVTNHVWELSELVKLYINQRIVHELPVLAVTHMLGQHSKVSFTDSSSYFCLHSDVSEARSFKLTNIIGDLRATNYFDDIERLLEFIQNNDDRAYYMAGYEQLLRFFHKPTIAEEVARALSVRFLLNHYMNIHWFRFPITAIACIRCQNRL